MKSSRWIPWMLGTLVAALCAVTLRVAAAPAPQGQSAFAAGYQAYQRGDLGTAIPNLQAAAVDSGVLEDYALFFWVRRNLIRMTSTAPPSTSPA